LLKGIPPGYAVRSVKGKICFPEKIGNAPAQGKGGAYARAKRTAGERSKANYPRE